MPASSTTTVVPGRSWNSGSGGRSGRCHSWSSLATVSERIPVSRSSTRAAFAVGATPNTARPCSCRSATAAASMRVLPAPAGPTTRTRRSSPATEAAASACSTSSPSPFTVVDGAGGSVWASIAQVMMCSSSASTASEVKRGAVGSIHSERPSDARRVVVVGWVEIDTVFEHPVGGALDGVEPAASRHLRHGTLHVTDRLQHVGPTPRRVLRRHRRHDLANRQRHGRRRVCGPRLDLGDELVDGPAGVGCFAPPPCRQIGGTVTGLAATGVRGRFSGHRRAFPP